VHGTYDYGYTPTCYDEQSKSIQASGNICRLDIVEIEGQDPLGTTTRTTWYSRRWDEKKIDALVLVYDTTSRRSFEAIRLLFDPTKHSRDTVIMLVGTKIDGRERREVRQAEGMVLAQKLGGSFSEVSSLKGLGIDEMIECLAFLLLERKCSHLNDTTEANAETPQKSYFESETPQTSFWNKVRHVLLPCMGRA
jgi:GTPase SAR1 family protein